MITRLQYECLIMFSPVQLMAEPSHQRQSLCQVTSALFEPLRSIGGLARGAAGALWQLQGEEWSCIRTYVHTHTHNPQPHPHLTPHTSTSLSACTAQHLTCVANRRLPGNLVIDVSVNSQCRTAQRSHHPASRGSLGTAQHFSVALTLHSLGTRKSCTILDHFHLGFGSWGRWQLFIVYTYITVYFFGGKEV